MVIARYRRVVLCIVVDIGDNGGGEWDGFTVNGERRKSGRESVGARGGR